MDLNSSDEDEPVAEVEEVDPVAEGPNVADDDPPAPPPAPPSAPPPAPPLAPAAPPTATPLISDGAPAGTAAAAAAAAAPAAASVDGRSTPAYGEGGGVSGSQVLKGGLTALQVHEVWAVVHALKELNVSAQEVVHGTPNPSP